PLEPPPGVGQPGGGIGIVYDFWVQSRYPGFTFAFALRTVASTVANNLTRLRGTPVRLSLPPGVSGGGGRGFWWNNQISADVAWGMAPATTGEHWTITGPAAVGGGAGPDAIFTKVSSVDP